MGKVKREKAYYDSLTAIDSHETYATRKKIMSAAHESIRFYYSWLRTHCPNKKVLEYGCGMLGNSAIYAAKMGAESVVGIDISEGATKKAWERAQKELTGQQVLNIAFLPMNAESLEFEDDSFDIICGSGIIHHIDPAKAFSELARTLKPDGQVILYEPLGHNFLINFYRKCTPEMRTKDERPLKVKDIQKGKEHFQSVEKHFFHLCSLLAIPFNKRSFFNDLLQLLEGADRGLFKLLPYARRFAWMVVIVLSHPRK